jgi:hypothetical protein
MIEEATRFEAAPDALLTGDADECYLTDLGTGMVFRLNATARLVFERARAGEDVRAITRTLAAAYPDVPEQEIVRDVRDVCAELVTAGSLRLA